MIPCSSPVEQYLAHKADIDSAVARILAGGYYILGEEVEAFENAFAAFCKTSYAVGVANGTDALTLALRAMDIGPGAEVITVSHTALATVAAILTSGATPVLVDVDPVYYTIDPMLVEAAITPKTRAIIAVHLYGQPADITAIKAIARRHGLRLIEDCAQSTGGLYQDRRLGSIGDAGTFSFYPTKNLGAIGDGGMVVTGDAALAERIARLRQYGWNAARTTVENGFNSRLDPLQAAILGVKLPTVDSDNARRAAIAARYNQALGHLGADLPQTRAHSRHVFHLYVLAHAARDALRAKMAGLGVDCGVHYPIPVHRHPGYAEKVIVPKGGLPVTERLAGTVLSLPMFPELSDAQVETIITAFQQAIAAD